MPREKLFLMLSISPFKLEENTLLISLSTSTFEESAKDDFRYDPYEWGDVWSTKAR